MEIRRDRYLERLIAHKGNGRVKIVTGIRRCGKSYLLFQLFKSHKLQMYLLENTIYIPQILEDRIAGLCYTYDSAAKSLMKDGSEEHKKAIEAFNQQKIRPLLNDLRDEFRRLLGVEFYDKMIKEDS